MATMSAIKGAFSRHPVLVNSMVGYSVFASGDMMAQQMADPDLEWDHRRSLSIGLLGIVQNGFLLRLWYRTLDKLVTPKVRCWFVFRNGFSVSRLPLGTGQGNRTVVPSARSLQRRYSYIV